MFKRTSVLFFTAAFLITLVLSGCTTEITAGDTLIGYWKSSYGDGFELKSGTPVMYYHYNDASKSVSFAGEVVHSPSLKSADGYLTVRITDSGSWNKTVGEYLVISWKNFNGSEVSESTPYKAGGASTLGSVSAARDEQTIDNGYFSFYSDCTRQK